MGDPNGIMIVDESGFPKKGNDSVGVARQYCNCPGKVENSQVGVFAAYASPQGMHRRISDYLFLRNGSVMSMPSGEKSADYPKKQNSGQNLSWLLR